MQEYQYAKQMEDILCEDKACTRVDECGLKIHPKGKQLDWRKQNKCNQCENLSVSPDHLRKHKYIC